MMVKVVAACLGDLCAGDIFQITDSYRDKYFMKTDGTENETPTAIDLKTGALYDLPYTTKVIFKKAILNVEE